MSEGCPRCGEAGLPILYGYPGDEMLHEVEAGRAVLGGCVFAGGLPTRHCGDCGQSWGGVEDDPVSVAFGKGRGGVLEEAAATRAQAGSGIPTSAWGAQIDAMLRQWAPLRPAPPAPWVADDQQTRMGRMLGEQRRLAEQGLWLGGDRTLLQVLGLTRDEAAHTRLLAWLLRPDGHHRAGRAALRALGAAAGVEESLLSGPVRVVREEERATADREEGEPATTIADLIVRTPGVTLLVEAKVDAHEQFAQLDRLRRTWSTDHGLRVLLVARSSHQQVTSVSGGGWPATSWARLADAVAERVQAPHIAELDVVLNVFRETP